MKARFGRIMAFTVACSRLLIGAAVAAPICPPPLSLKIAAGGGAMRAGKNLHIKAVLRNRDMAAALADVSLKIALPAGLCPIKTSTAPTLHPRQRAVVEGTASGGVNVYWSSMNFKAGGKRNFYVKTLVAANLTGPATLPIEALAWIGSDGQCSVAAQPLGVSRSIVNCMVLSDRPLFSAIAHLLTPTHTSRHRVHTGASPQLIARQSIQEGDGVPQSHPFPAAASARRPVQCDWCRPAVPGGPARAQLWPTRPRADRLARGRRVLRPLLRRGVRGPLPLQRRERRGRVLVLRRDLYTDQ